MRKISTRVASALCGLLIGLGTARLSYRPTQLNEVEEAKSVVAAGGQPSEQATPNPEIDESNRLSDAFVDDEQLGYNGYVVSKLYKRVTLDYPPECKCAPARLDVSYAVITRKNIDVAKFDAGIYQGLGGGNRTHFGLYPFLGGPMKELVVSQEVSRGGTQWVATLTPRLHIIFDGPAWGAGREAYDMEIKDFDADGVYEITVPITDFYDLQDKMPISGIPLPTIIFKYDVKAKRYLPANKLFPEYALQEVPAYRYGVDSTDEFFARSRILHVLLDYVYAGKRDEGWSFFDRTYKLSDREEVRQRVNALLKDQPVYKFIYRS